MIAADKITKAKVQLILSQPFFATILMSLQMVQVDTIKTAETDGKSIFYNPAYIDGLSIDEVKGFLCHEVMHIASLHTTRRNGRELKQWNEATDYAINPMIEQCGFILPKGHLQNAAYAGKGAEEIYNLLPAKKDDKNNDQGNDPGNSGGVKDTPAQTQAEQQQQEAEIKQQIAQAAHIAKQAGKLPAYLQRIVDQAMEVKINWKEVLNRFISEQAKNDYSFSQPNPRFLHTGFCMPSLKNEEPGNIFFIVDTSGSIDKELFNQFATELKDVCNEIGAGITVIYVDTQVQAVEEYQPGDNFTPDAKGGGGTDFRPGFDYIESEGLRPTAAIYLTDGDCEEFPAAPDFPVLWAIYGGRKFAEPFGETINVD